MDKQQPVLSVEEQNELRQGQDLYEMTKTSGFQTLQSWLQDMAYHSWADPRETNNREEWEWRELNSFHAANIARELMERIQTAVNRGEYLEKKKSGEIVVKKMGI
jgi:queuine/archaeosine tRNA-ribosyltransferase